MDPKKHRFIVIAVGLIFVFGVLTNIFLLNPDLAEVVILGVAIMLVIGLAVGSIRRYRHRFY